MPELNAIHIALLVITTIVGAVAGWVARSTRSVQEKAAVSSEWQNQIEAQRREHERLLGQNKSLMEQVSQFQAQHTDAKNRAKELSIAVQEAYGRRDELQREIKDIRGNLETVLSERDQLASNMRARDDGPDALQARDRRIEQLAKELENWQNRLPPLIERFRTRNAEAEQLEAELAEARERIRELEDAQHDAAGQTQIEPVEHPEDLTAGYEASNDPDDEYIEETSFAAVDDETGTDKEASDEAPVGDDPVDTAADDEEPGDEESVDEEAISETETHDENLLFDDRDDLKMIKGVGPAIEKTLNEMGIVSFRQIADMSEYDIDRIANRLKGFHTRIYREDWIGQARALLDEAAHA
jgi:predicted flap endonuclease-1-like 5' DNA nuclease/predicted  nucleic acid-binding Zn-ribbon protein